MSSFVIKSLKEVLMERDSMSAEEADKVIKEAREQLTTYIENGMMLEAQDICEEYFGLEPDYIDELL